MNKKVRCLIIGSGASRLHGCNIRIQSKSFGHIVEGITGTELMDDLIKQVIHFGADIRIGTATKVDLASLPKQIVIDSEKTIEPDLVRYFSFSQ